MKVLIALLRSEPAVLGSLVGAAVTLAASFGFSLSADQIAAVTAVASIIIGLVVRSQVSPVVPVVPVPGPPAA